MGLDNPLHIAFLLLVLLLVFGARRLPEMGRSLGSGLREFKQSIGGELSQPLAPVASAQPQAQPVAPVVSTQPQAPSVASTAASSSREASTSADTASDFAEGM